MQDLVGLCQRRLAKRTRRAGADMRRAAHWRRQTHDGISCDLLPIALILPGLNRDLGHPGKKRPRRIDFNFLIFLRKSGAGEGNRTLVCSLGSCRSTIELHPLIKDLEQF